MPLSPEELRLHDLRTVIIHFKTLVDLLQSNYQFSAEERKQVVERLHWSENILTEIETLLGGRRESGA